MGSLSSKCKTSGEEAAHRRTTHASADRLQTEFLFVAENFFLEHREQVLQVSAEGGGTLTWSRQRGVDVEDIELSQSSFESFHPFPNETPLGRTPRHQRRQREQLLDLLDCDGSRKLRGRRDTPDLLEREVADGWSIDVEGAQHRRDRALAPEVSPRRGLLNHAPLAPKPPQNPARSTPPSVLHIGSPRSTTVLGAETEGTGDAMRACDFRMTVPDANTHQVAPAPTSAPATTTAGAVSSPRGNTPRGGRSSPRTPRGGTALGLPQVPGHVAPLTPRGVYVQGRITPRTHASAEPRAARPTRLLDHAALPSWDYLQHFSPRQRAGGSQTTVSSCNSSTSASEPRGASAMSLTGALNMPGVRFDPDTLQPIAAPVQGGSPSKNNPDESSGVSAA